MTNCLEMAVIDFLYEIIVTVVSGGVLAILFFWVREQWFSLPEIEGRWFIELKTTTTDYNPFKDMILIYEAMLWREGNLIKGTAEKIHENSEKKQGDYIGEHRTRSQVDGYIEKRYFGTDRIFLHVVEQGHGRESTTFYTLVFKSRLKKMSGTFVSMVAASSGKVDVRRKREPLYFQPMFELSARQ